MGSALHCNYFPPESESVKWISCDSAKSLCTANLQWILHSFVDSAHSALLRFFAEQRLFCGLPILRNCYILFFLISPTFWGWSWFTLRCLNCITFLFFPPFPCDAYLSMLLFHCCILSDCWQCHSPIHASSGSRQRQIAHHSCGDLPHSRSH